DLINQGAAPALSVQNVLGALDLQMVEPQKVVRQVVETTALEERLLAELGAEPLHVDDVGRRCDVSPAELSSALTLLELKGLVRQVGAMTYVRI
ncbi:MAG: DNA-processing protein DprA, partial [Ardenticatenaceae bacterium]